MILDSSELLKRAGVLRGIEACCTLCPRRCRVDRRNTVGFCRRGWEGQVASAGPHFGEEPPLVGQQGSGTVFFFGCNLGCIFCQNWEISRGSGSDLTPLQLGSLFCEIQKMGCHNLNLVTPTPHLASIAESLSRAVDTGFSLPVVYNCGGYEDPEILAILEGMVDIYMPDAKTMDADWSSQYLKCVDYPEYLDRSLREMFRQTGNLVLSCDGIASSGLLVRHLLMPGRRQDTEKVIDLVVEICGKDAYLNLMDQYRPCFQADRYPGLSRRLDPLEFHRAVDYAISRKITRGLDPRYLAL